MTEALTSFMRGYTAQDYYQSDAGLFRGGLAAGFMVSMLARFPMQSTLVNNLLIDESGILLGNFEPSAAVDGQGSGWYVSYQIESEGDLSITFNYANAANVVTSVVLATAPAATGASNQRTFLLNWVFGVNSTRDGASNLLIYANGGLISANAIASYTPAPATNRFLVGNGSIRIGGQTIAFPSSSAELSGFSFLDGLPGANNAADDLTLAAVQASINAQWTAALRGLNVHDDSDADLGPLWDVRTGAPNPPTSWAASQNSQVELARVGSASLETVASPPYFYGGFAV